MIAGQPFGVRILPRNPPDLRALTSECKSCITTSLHASDLVDDNVDTVLISSGTPFPSILDGVGWVTNRRISPNQIRITTLGLYV